MSIIITTEIWYKRIPEKNKLKYDHSRAVYTRGKDKVEIICPKHDSFFQIAELHAKGAGCPKCADENGGSSQRKSQEDFVSQSIAIGDGIDHSLVVYKRSTTKVDLICHKEGHGKFSMLPLNRLRGAGCRKCGRELANLKTTKTQAKFIEECLALPMRGLTYNKAVYKSDKVNVTVTCDNHGDFEMWPSNILQGQGCPKCAKHGYNVDKPGYIYILGTDKSDGGICKVGITNRNPVTRAKEVSKSSGKKFHVLFHAYCVDGQRALLTEKIAHKWLADRHDSTQSTFDGSTECFDSVDYGQLLLFLISPLASPESV